jgi:RNA polymerase sigma-70 factor, ECF subfamily
MVGPLRARHRLEDAVTTGMPAIPKREAIDEPRDSRPSLRAVFMPSSEDERARAFRGLYDAQVPFVWRILRRLGVPEAEADDRTQEVFVVAHRRFHEFEERGHGPRAWLFQIAIRVASGARRHMRRHPDQGTDGNAVLDQQTVDAPQVTAMERREALVRLDAALATLPLGRRAVFVLHEIEELTAPEVAEVLSIPLNTVYSRLRVARAEIDQAIASQGEPR